MNTWGFHAGLLPACRKIGRFSCLPTARLLEAAGHIGNSVGESKVLPMEMAVELCVDAEDVAQVAAELQRDFERTCEAITSDLAASDDPTHWLDVLTAVGSEAVGLSAELSERLETDLMPQVVQLLLGKSFDLSAVERVNAFLQWTLVDVGGRFRQGDVCRLSCLARVLDAHRRFYLYHGTSNDANQDGDADGRERDESQQSELRFTVRDKSEYTSQYFLRNLEFWGKLGGFSLLLDVLGAGNSSFEALQCVLRTLYDVKDHLDPQFIAQYFPKLADAVCALVVKLESAELYALTRDSLLEVVQVMELLLVKIQHDVDAAERADGGRDSADESYSNALLVREVCEQRLQLLRLEISLRFFQSSSLEKRIYGLTEIVVIITRLYNDQIQEQPEPTAASLYAVLGYLVDWLGDKQLVQELLGEKMHVELVKRATSLFQFASELECLPTEWIDLVWGCYHADTGDSVGAEQDSQPIQRRHEAFRSTIQDLLLEMVTFMELPSLKHLACRIEAVKAKLDSNQLGLLAAIAARRLLGDARGDEPSLRERILRHLWLAVLPSVRSDGFGDEVLLRMHEMLRLEATGDECGEGSEEVALAKSCAMVDELLGSCLTNIRRRESLTISLKLFTQLSSLVAETGTTVSVQDTSYVHLVLDETVKYKQEVRGALQGSAWGDMDDDTRVELPALKDHVGEIKNRLLALRAAWVLDEHGGAVEPSLSEAQLDSVWQLLIVESFVLDEAALCFQWIELCMNTPLRPRLDPETASSPRGLMPLEMAEYLLTTKFSTLPGDRVTLSTLGCFHSVFRRINLVQGGLEVCAASPSSSPTGRARSGSSSDDDKEDSVELMTGQPLVGLDELWQLAVRATDVAVAEEAITLLASFHLAFAPSVRRTDRPFQCKVRFVEKCMGFIATAKANVERARAATSPVEGADGSDSVERASNVAVVNRCVDLLRYFLEACKIGEDSAEKESAEARRETLESTGISVSTGASSNSGNVAKTAFRIDHLEERLPYLEIYPSPMKDVQSDASSGAKLGYRAGRRPSWTFRQQHALLDVIVDANEEVDADDTKPAELAASRRDEELLRRSLDSPMSRHSDSEYSPLKAELGADLSKTASPIKASTRSSYARASVRWPQAPSPQRGPDLRPEDINQALNDVSALEENTSTESSKPKARYGLMSQLLANQGAHFDVLLEFVDWEESTSQRTWDLLCRLPTNNELLCRMIRLRCAEKDGVVDWAALLDGASIQRLLYALRLVEALLIPVEAAGSGNGALDSGRRQWRERFVRLGGARHLYETLLKWPREHSPEAAGDGDSIFSQYTQNLRATCLAAVMRVLDYFLRWDRLIAAQKETLSSFDLRLQSVTLPGFIQSVELSAMLQAAVQLTGRLCSRKPSCADSLSDEAAEAVYCGVQLCCSLIRFSPLLISMVFTGSESEAKDPAEDCYPRTTISGWLQALLVDCSSKATRVQVLGALSEMALAFGVMDSCSPARKVFDSLVVSACDLISADASATYTAVALEELFTFGRLLLRCCGHMRAHKGMGSEENSEGHDTLSAALVRKRVPRRLVGHVRRLVSTRQVSFSPTSTRVSRNHEEGLLRGHLQLLALLASISEELRVAILLSCPTDPSSEATSEQMLRFVHDRLLFGEVCSDLELARPPECKTSAARDVAYQLLLSLVFPQSLDLHRVEALDSLSQDVRTLLSGLRGYQERVLESVNLAGRQWNYSPADSFLHTDKSTPHAGLVNPGCICYMNALVQQLFMMPSFSEGLLALDCSQLAATQSSSSWAEAEEVEQLQRLFVSLAFTKSRSCDPTTFARAHKDMDGNATDVHVQMDADEFFCLLLDRLEMCMRPAASSLAVESDGPRDFMARCFDGVLVNQILTQQGNLSEREEKFFALSLEVSKKRHLAESLELYVQGEALEGENAYFCEREQRKVSATKRVCIRKLPQTLVCHLKRFEFDYDTMEKLKINDLLEFPMELDMFPYTSEALAAANADDTSRMYDLVGVVVHSGTSDTGHYYSFIKDRHEAESQRWLEFNDEVVREFDADAMGDECFGGEEVAQQWDPVQGAYSPIVQMKRRSAYMLIYERRALADASALPEAAVSLTLSDKAQSLATQVMQENARYEGVVNAFDASYERFICSLVEDVARLPVACNPALIRQAYQLGCQFVFGISSLRCRPSASSTPAPVAVAESTSSPRQVSALVSIWLSGYHKNPGTEADDERRQFAQWLLAGAIASPPVAAAAAVESQRTWLFDVLFLSSEGVGLAESCFHALAAAVTLLESEAAADDTDALESLTAFLRELLSMFWLREGTLQVSDPASGCVLTLSADARVEANKLLGAFLERCVGASMAAEGSAIRRVFLVHLQFLNRFLHTLQTPFEPSDVVALAAAHQTSARGVAPLAIEAQASTEPSLRVCTLQLGVRLLRHLLGTYNDPTPPPVDTTLVTNHAALKNVVLLGLEDVAVPLLTRAVFDSESPSSTCNRLVALLIGVLEEVKATHAQEVLALFAGILDAEDARVQAAEAAEDASGSTWSAYHHVFSPSRGLLESVVYHRDHHGSHAFTLLVLEFVVRRAASSKALQKLFRGHPQFCSHVNWIPGWLVDHLDSSGAIRSRVRRPGSGAALPTQDAEVEALFSEIEKAFGVPVPAFCEAAAPGEEQQLLVSPIAAEDVLLEALDQEQENQREAAQHKAGRSRWLGKSMDEVGPEHEGAEAEMFDDSSPDWKPHRTREELSILLRIDLDGTHNSAREA
jgi:ubiquitin C-terminal hydrolase